jgi:4-hydroxythreonine-4-phosphate dehydrogenase
LNDPIAITCGDPSGVGPEVVSAWLRGAGTDAARATVIGPARWLETLPSSPRKVAVGLEDYAAVPGRPDGDGSLVAWAALETAARLCSGGECAGAVTGPVSKERLAAIGWPFAGQTEFFASRWGGSPTMAFCGGRLRVALLSWHLPFREVPSRLTLPEFERTVGAADLLARSYGAGSPRIGVCGLNPHAGEGGLIGTEERDTIDPILDGLRARYPGLSRCLPADTIFGRQLRGEFDAVVALYHDQGLGPLKTVEFEEAVNATLGLPSVRTSPDHGTGFSIAGTGRASPRSFANAVDVARRLIRARNGG